jgi:hypothetical protein
VLTGARDRRPKFATYTIKRTIAVPSERIDQLVRWLSTDAGYINAAHVCCNMPGRPIAQGLRLVRGPVVVDLMIQCGRIRLGAPPTWDDEPVVEGNISEELYRFVDSLIKSPCSR